ncbi:hypothetical protein AWB76_01852 [Caballeronia temeraria]|uniref:Uncharacterized protein n=1 Tax=Caballeronia temeraria TaxID=1777137 RepID=A0A158A6F2_9BURK|nr:hypothetical protein [Caballeronia temeraria]SAK53412.1 hypothetical protein AWB76_01852 [Caballeronia temeraria]
MPAAQATETKEAIEGFAISALDGHTFGTNGIGVRMNGKVRIGISHSITEDEISGAGSFVNRLSPDDLNEARKIHHLLCEIGERKDNAGTQHVESATVYSVTCLHGNDEVDFRGSIDDLPADLRDAAYRFYRRMYSTYLDGARADVKLDIVVDSIVRQKADLLVAVKFINSGDYDIGIKTPENLHLPNGIWINAKGQEKDDEWVAMLSGSRLQNKSEFPNEWTNIPARSAITFTILVVPKNKLKAGTYSLTASVVMGISSKEFPVNTMGLVDFHSDYKNPTKVTFDHDYPSTPQEWKAFEAHKAKEVSALPAGATVAEPGYYRMTSAFGTRSPFVTKLEDGQAAPKLDYAKWDQWQWEADLALPTICKPGEACSRDGRWVLRTMQWSPNPDDQTHAQYERRFQIGDPLPAFEVSNEAASKLYWEWLSA